MEQIYRPSRKSQSSKIMILVILISLSQYSAWLGIDMLHNHRVKFAPIFFVLSISVMCISYISFSMFREMYLYSYRFWKGRLIVIPLIKGEQTFYSRDILYATESESLCALILHNGDRFVIPNTYTNFEVFRREFQAFAYDHLKSIKKENISQPLTATPKPNSDKGNL